MVLQLLSWWQKYFKDNNFYKQNCHYCEEWNPIKCINSSTFKCCQHWKSQHKEESEERLNIEEYFNPFRVGNWVNKWNNQLEYFIWPKLVFMMTDLKTPCPTLPVPLGQNEALQKRMSHQFISFTREVLYILGKVCKNQFFSLFNCTFTIKCVQARGGLTIFMRSKWLLDLDFFNGKK